MNNEELKKLLKSVEICENPGICDCNVCPLFEEKNCGDGCSEAQYKLAKKLLQEMEQEEKTTVRETKTIIFGDQTTRNVVLKWLHDGGDMIVGYKPTEDYKQWLVGHVVTIDLAKAELTVMGLSTGFITRNAINSYSRMIEWRGGPTADLICTDAIGGYLLGECYHIRNGQMSPCLDTRLIPAKDGRFASLEDGFIKKHFAIWKGDVHFGKDELNGYFVCTESSGNFTKGRRYAVVNGCFQDDNGIIWDELVTGYLSLDELLEQSNLRYVPDEK